MLYILIKILINHSPSESNLEKKEQNEHGKRMVIPRITDTSVEESNGKVDCG